MSEGTVVWVKLTQYEWNYRSISQGTWGKVQHFEWKYRSMKVLQYEGTAVWRYRSIKVPQYKGTAVWRYCSMKVLQYEGTAVWRYRSMKVPQYEAVLQYEGSSLKVPEPEVNSNYCRCGPLPSILVYSAEKPEKSGAGSPCIHQRNPATVILKYHQIYLHDWSKFWRKIVIVLT